MNDMLLKLWIKAQILREDHAQDMVEYALVVGIIALGATVALQSVSGADFRACLPTLLSFYRRAKRS